MSQAWRRPCASAPCVHAKAICRCAGGCVRRTRRSRWFFAALLELLLERRELGEWRIGIRLLVPSSRSAPERLSVILLALGTIDTVAAVAAGPVPLGPAIVPFDTHAL